MLPLELNACNKLLFYLLLFRSWQGWRKTIVEGYKRSRGQIGNCLLTLPGNRALLNLKVNQVLGKVFLSSQKPMAHGNVPHWIKHIHIFFAEKKCNFHARNWEKTAWTGVLRGYCTSYPKLACSVLYLKIINTFLKIIYTFYSKLSKELKNGIGILEGQTVFKLWIKTSKCCLDQ